MHWLQSRDAGRIHVSLGSMDIMCTVRTLRVARTSPRLTEVVAWRATGSPRSIEFAGERVGPTASDGQPAVSADARLAGPEAERPPSST